MSEWFATCSITNLPIREKERVVMFLIVEVGDEYYKSNCSGNLTHNLIPIPFRGVYNGFSWMKFDDGQKHKLDYLSEHISKDKPFTSFDSLNKASEVDNKHIVTGFHGNGKFKLATMFVREDAFDSLRECVFAGSHYYKPMNEEYLIGALDDYYGWLNSSFEEIKSSMQNLSPNSSEWQRKRSELFFRQSSGDLMLMEYMDNHIGNYRERNDMVIEYSAYGTDYKLLTYFTGRFGSETGYYTAPFLTDSVNILSRNEMIDVFAFHTMCAELRRGFRREAWFSGETDGTNAFTKAFPLIYENSAFMHDAQFSYEDLSDDPEFCDLVDKRKALLKELEEVQNKIIGMC